MKTCTTALIAATVLLSACAPQGSKNDAELAAMDGRWEAAFTAGDLDALAALYTDDARLMAPNEATTQGSEAVRASFQGMLDQGLGVQLEPVESVSAGDIGYNVGTYTVTTPDGTAVDTGRYVETWRKVDGAWKISNDIWNSDQPPPSAPLMVATHRVKNRDTWVAAWQNSPERRAQFAANGAPKVRALQSMTDPGLVGLAIDLADAAAFEAFLASPEGAAAAAADTVEMPTLQRFTEIR